MTFSSPSRSVLYSCFYSFCPAVECFFLPLNLFLQSPSSLISFIIVFPSLSLSPSPSQSSHKQTGHPGNPGSQSHAPPKTIIFELAFSAVCPNYRSFSLSHFYFYCSFALNVDPIEVQPYFTRWNTPKTWIHLIFPCAFCSLFSNLIFFPSFLLFLSFLNVSFFFFFVALTY